MRVCLRSLAAGLAVLVISLPASAQVLVTPTAASPTSSARPALASPAASSTHLWVPLLVVVLAVGGIAVWFALWRRRARRPATPADPMPSS